MCVCVYLFVCFLLGCLSETNREFGHVRARIYPYPVYWNNVDFFFFLREDKKKRCRSSSSTPPPPPHPPGWRGITAWNRWENTSLEKRDSVLGKTVSITLTENEEVSALYIG